MQMCWRSLRPNSGASKRKSRPLASLVPIMNILIVDDDPTSRIILEAMLRTLGHEITAKENGAQAFAHFSEAPAPVPLVISDMIMPEMDGLELCYKIRHAHRP